jgi:Mn2+/Fe2+ NRAMP family transporter
MPDAGAALLRSLTVFVPVSMMFVGAAVGYARRKGTAACLQLLGATGLVLVVVLHVFEAVHALPWMGWGRQHSAGHYLDVASALIGGTLFPLGYLLDSLRKAFVRLDRAK